jgi:hypothetical protein
MILMKYYKASQNLKYCEKSGRQNKRKRTCSKAVAISVSEIAPFLASCNASCSEPTHAHIYTQRSKSTKTNKSRRMTKNSNQQP